MAGKVIAAAPAAVPFRKVRRPSLGGVDTVGLNLIIFSSVMVGNRLSFHG